MHIFWRCLLSYLSSASCLWLWLYLLVHLHNSFTKMQELVGRILALLSTEEGQLIQLILIALYPLSYLFTVMSSTGNTYRFKSWLWCVNLWNVSLNMINIEETNELFLFLHWTLSLKLWIVDLSLWYSISCTPLIFFPESLTHGLTRNVKEVSNIVDAVYRCYLLDILYMYVCICLYKDYNNLVVSMFWMALYVYNLLRKKRRWNDWCDIGFLFLFTLPFFLLRYLLLCPVMILSCIYFVVFGQKIARSGRH